MSAEILGTIGRTDAIIAGLLFVAKSKFMALEKPGKLRKFFLLLCGHCVTLFTWKIFFHRRSKATGLQFCHSAQTR